MLESDSSVDVELIADRARSLWREGSATVSTARIELFAKLACRLRVARERGASRATIHRSVESGLAVRAIRAGHDLAGFASSSGMNSDVLRWAVDTATSYHAQASASRPQAAHVAAERWDLDRGMGLPAEDALTHALLSRPGVSWIEAGTTVEVLVGAEGWLAARRRHRMWALIDRPTARLVAQRGFSGWEAMLDAPERGLVPAGSTRPAGREFLVFTPEAAAAVVTALVGQFHGAGMGVRTRSGVGWDIADEPSRPKGLAGGTFDDAGFSATDRVLAKDGLWVGSLEGPGSLWRSSFRNPPVESASNLVMDGGITGRVPPDAAIVERSHVVRAAAHLWVLELEFREGGAEDRRWVRLNPELLLGACRSRLGDAQVTAEGPIVPALVFEALPTA